MKDIRVELNDLDYSREKIKESKGLTALQKCRIFDAIDGARVILKEQQNQLFELQDHNEYLQDKLKEQETANLYKCPNCGTWVSAENVVRCKDCVNSGTSRCPCHYSGDPFIDWNPDDDWFCADGERKES